MREYLEIETVPALESCEQVGPNYDSSNAMREARAFKNQLLRQFPPPEGGEIRIRSASYDFGSYLELRLYYTDDKSGEWAFHVENNLPEHWDEEAKAELGILV